MATELQIVNMALRMLGDDPLTQAEYDSQLLRRATLAAQYLPTTRDVLVSSYPWNFATVRTTLTADVLTPDWGYDYRFAVPALCLRVLEVNGDTNFEREASYLLSDETTLEIKYLEQILDYTLFPPWFAATLAAALAIDMCQADTGRTDILKTVEEIYAMRIQRAQGFDGQEGTPPRDYTSQMAWDR